MSYLQWEIPRRPGWYIYQYWCGCIYHVGTSWAFGAEVLVNYGHIAKHSSARPSATDSEMAIDRVSDAELMKKATYMYVTIAIGANIMPAPLRSSGRRYFCCRWSLKNPRFFWSDKEPKIVQDGNGAWVVVLCACRWHDGIAFSFPVFLSPGEAVPIFPEFWFRRIKKNS